jgi:hypothetical protein
MMFTKAAMSLVAAALMAQQNAQAAELTPLMIMDYVDETCCIDLSKQGFTGTIPTEIGYVYMLYIYIIYYVLMSFHIIGIS